MYKMDIFSYYKNLNRPWLLYKCKCVELGIDLDTVTNVLALV